MRAYPAIPCFSWIQKASQVKAVLLCIHGLGLHAGTYSAFGEIMAEQGIATYALDVRGFGTWLGQDGTVLNFPQCLQDIKGKLEELRELHPTLPIFLLGESLGGAITTQFAVDYPHLMDGIILCAPARALYDHKVEAFRVILRLLRHPNQPISISSSVFRYAPHVVALQKNDARIRLHFRAEELIHLGFFLLLTGHNASRITNLPVLIIQGEGDPVISAHSTLRFFQRIPSKDKDLIVLGNVEHLIFQGVEVNHRAVRVVQQWIEGRTDEPANGRADLRAA